MSYKLLLLVSIFFLHCVAVTNACGQWVRCSGPYGGTVHTLAASGTTLFAGVLAGANNETGGVFRSTDFGTSWSETSLAGYGITAIGTLGTTIFADANSKVDANGKADANGKGLYRSTNNGIDWTLLDSNFTNVSAFASIGTTLFAITGTGAYASTDSGISWHSKPWPISTPGDYFSRAIATSGTTLFLGTAGLSDMYSGTFNGDIFRSTDSGSSWSVVDSGLTRGINTGVDSIVAFAVSGANLFVALAGDNGGIFQSTDNGTSWREIVQSTFIYPLTSLAVSGRALYAGTKGDGVHIYMQNDTSWNEVSVGINNAEIDALLAVGSAVFASATEDGLFFTNDIGANWTWSAVNAGLPSTNVTSFVANGAALFCGTRGDGVFESSDGGASWNATKSEPNNAKVESLIMSDTNLIAGTSSSVEGSNIFLSSDNGASWIGVNPFYPSLGAYGFAVLGKNLYAACSGGTMGDFGGGVLLSSDDGLTWSTFNNGLTDHALEVQSLQKIGSKLYAITVAGVFLLTDDGPGQSGGWLPAAGKFPNANTLVTIGANVILGGTGIYRSIDSGATWALVSLKDTIISSLALHGENLYAATTSGVLISRDSGTTWKTTSDGLSNNPRDVTALLISGTTLLAGTNGTSVWRAQLSDLKVKQPTAPTKFSIAAYPNPFSDRTTIKCTSTEHCVAEVSVINILGERVAQLYKGELNAGEHEFNWSATGLHPGMYVCVVHWNGRLIEHSFVLAR